MIIMAVILVLLIVPVYLLWHLTDGPESKRSTAIIISVLLVFTLIFSGALSLFTRAKRHEILASAAAYEFHDASQALKKLTNFIRYCAVLVVFIGNIGQLSPN